ncbi:MAG: carboxypeptidase-like regulatory domain-containing protein, partial [Gemmatimonadales bacterium]
MSAVCVTWLLTCCTAGEVELYEPEGSGLAQGLTVKVELEESAAEIGEALGWTEGVPDAEVRVHRLGTEFRWQTALTDSAGQARFPYLIQGRYRLAA